MAKHETMTMRSTQSIAKRTMFGRTKAPHHILLILAASLSAIVPAYSSAASFQSPEMLHAIAMTFLEQQTARQQNLEAEISIGRLDRRLRLTECTTKPTAFLAAGAKLQGKLSVGLRCTGNKPWTVYLTAQIKSFTHVITAAHALPRGTLLSSADLMTVRQDVSQLRSGYFTQNKNVVGKILKRPMSAGQAFSVKNVKPPLLVRRGDEVVILATTGGLQVRVKGKALKDAALGERVPVRNKQSKRIVQGTAVKAGVVSIQM